MKNYLAAMIATLLLASPAICAAETWSIDPAYSHIGFEVRKLMYNVKGEFSRYTSDLEIDEEDITRSQASVAIDVASIDTNNEDRDEHLRSLDYFDVAKYPKMTFVAKEVVKTGGERLRVIGDLTLHGVTREVALEVGELSAPTIDETGHLHRHATATTEINRKEFGLTWNSLVEGGGMVVGNKVKIILDIEMIKT